MGEGQEDPMHAPVKPGLPAQYYTRVLFKWSPSMMRYGAFLGCMFLYFTDWQLFMDKVPYYNKKFEKKEPLV